MTYETPANLTDEERDYLIAALQERNITPEMWDEGIHSLKMIVEFVSDNQDYLGRFFDYVRREAEKDPRMGESVFEDDYLETILRRAMDAMETPDKQQSLGFLMNGSQLQTLTRVLTSGGEPQESSVTRSEKWEIKEHPNKENASASSITFTRKNRGVEHTITITNPDLFFPGSTRSTRKRGTIITRKLLPYVLQRMTEQNYPDAIRIDLTRLASTVGYKNEDTAYKAVVRFVQQMGATDLSWTKKSGKDKEVTSSGGILFIHRRRQGGTAYIYVNKQFDLRELAKQFTVFPEWAYSLSPVAFDLVRYVFYIARQNTKGIAESGIFNIGLEAILYATGLPTPEEVTGRRYRQLIRNPIEDAIAEIENRVAEVPEAKGNFFITPHVDEATTDIDQWLKGYLEIELRNEYAHFFTTLAERQGELIRRAREASGKEKKTRARKGK